MQEDSVNESLMAAAMLHAAEKRLQSGQGVDASSALGGVGSSLAACVVARVVSGRGRWQLALVTESPADASWAPTGDWYLSRACAYRAMCARAESL